MEKREKILELLSRVAAEFNKNNITWGVGASLLLYFKGMTTEFHDIDIMVDENDVEKVKQILSQLGTLQPAKPNEGYKTKHFLEFVVEEVDIDVIAGFVIVCHDKDYYFPFDKDSIREYIDMSGVSIPLQAVEDWYTYYKLMGRTEKVKMIEERYHDQNILCAACTVPVPMER